MTNVLIFDSQATYYAAELARAVPSARYDAALTLDEAIAKAPEAEVLIGLAPALKPPLLEAATGLKWIQALTTGVDNLMHLQGVALTNCHGIHGPQMSELAVLLTLASLRKFPSMIEAQKAASWDRNAQPLMRGKTACIIGLGAIAEHLARVLAAFEMRVTGVSGRAEAPGFDRIFPRAELTNAVAEADVVIVLVPYTPETHHIVNAEVIAAMKPTAHLVNIARGGCVDEQALRAALVEGRIAGAALDVFATEPLPADSPLWSTPNLIVTPHVGGFSDAYHEQALPILIENMAAYASGGVDALKGRVDQ